MRREIHDHFYSPLNFLSHFHGLCVLCALENKANLLYKHMILTTQTKDAKRERKLQRKIIRRQRGLRGCAKCRQCGKMACSSLNGIDRKEVVDNQNCVWYSGSNSHTNLTISAQCISGNGSSIFIHFIIIFGSPQFGNDRVGAQRTHTPHIHTIHSIMHTIMNFNYYCYILFDSIRRSCARKSSQNCAEVRFEVKRAKKRKNLSQFVFVVSFEWSSAVCALRTYFIHSWCSELIAEHGTSTKAI